MRSVNRVFIDIKEFTGYINPSHFSNISFYFFTITTLQKTKVFSCQLKLLEIKFFAGNIKI
jgi:hypothetical protein